MDETSAGIESELLDLSTKNVATLRSVELSGMTEAMTRVRLRIADSEGSISGYSGSWTNRPDESGPDESGPEAEEHRG